MSSTPDSKPKSENRVDGSPRQENVVGDCYLLHFSRPISETHTCQHYLGWSEDLGKRLAAHKAGKGSNLTAVAKRLGITYRVVRVWEGVTRDFERKLKNRKNAPGLCPVCVGRKAAKKARNAKRRADYAAAKAAKASQ